MPFPQPSDYDDAIQNPKTAFIDAELQHGTNDGPLRFGMPGPVASGNFAVVYRFRCGAKRYAVKCFTRQPPQDQEKRFSSIHRHLHTSRLSCATEFQFLPGGIRVRGILYPILKMEWLEAPTLLDYVPRNLQNRDEFRQLSESFLSLCGELSKNQVAHGDLQHGNLLVLEGKLKIIDYDGMCVPGTAGLPSEEDGLPHYQHPQRRGGNLAPYFDHFPSLVIWTSLYALSVDSGLWERYVHNEERLLFSKEDFLNPQGSAVFQELLSYGDERLTKAVTALRDACSSKNLAAVPLLNDIVHSVSIVVDPEWWRSSQPPTTDTAPVGAVASAKHGQPDWMQPDLPMPLPARFRYSMALDRIFAYAYVSLSTVAGVSVLMNAISADAMIIGVFTLGSLLCMRLSASYVDAPAVKQKNLCAIRLRQARARLIDYEMQLNRWKTDQDQLIEKEARPMKEQEAKLAQLQTQMHQRQAEFDAQLQRLLQGMSIERKQIDAKEREALQSLSHEARQLETTQQERLRQLESNSAKIEADLAAQMDQLRREKIAKKESFLKKLRDEKLRAELMRVPIRVATVESLTAGNVVELQNKGIRYAGDFTDCHSQTSYSTGYTVYLIVKADGSRVKVPGIGEKRANALLQWRREQEQQVLRRSPVSLPQSAIDAIEGETEHRRQEMMRKISPMRAEATRLKTEAAEVVRKKKAEIAGKESAARQASVSARATLDGKENQERRNTEARKAEAISVINREIWQLQSVINPAKHKIDKLQEEYQRQLAGTSKDHGEVLAAVSSVEREMSQFKNINLRRYCTRVFAFASE